MPSPTILVINAKTLGLSSYKTGDKVWVVSLDSKFGRPFVVRKITDDRLKTSDFYQV
jgi:hypothetical protein